MFMKVVLLLRNRKFVSTKRSTNSLRNLGDVFFLGFSPGAGWVNNPIPATPDTYTNPVVPVYRH